MTGQKISVLDGEAVIETARVEVFVVGSGAVITATLVEEDGTAIAAASEILPVFSMEAGTEAAQRILKGLRARLDASTSGEEVRPLEASVPPLDPWPLEYPDGSRARNFEGGVADHLDLDGNIYDGGEIGRGLQFKPRLGFEQDETKYHGIGDRPLDPEPWVNIWSNGHPYVDGEPNWTRHAESAGFQYVLKPRKGYEQDLSRYEGAE